MAKPKKLTVKIYENRQIVKPYESEFEQTQFWPLYVTVTYNGKIKNIKSLTFEFLERLNMNYDLISEDWEAIRKNDERLFGNFKKFIESKNQEFSLDLVSPTNSDFQKAKLTIYDFYSSHLRAGLFKALHNHSWTIQALITSNNLIAFSYMLGELKPEIFEDFKSKSPKSYLFLEEIIELSNQKIFPFMVDVWVKEPFLSQLTGIFSNSDQ